MSEKSMNKTEFAKFILKKYSITRGEALKIINMFTDSVTDALSKINELSLIGFGSFSVSDVAAREGRNPKDGSPIKLLPTDKQDLNLALISKKWSISSLKSYISSSFKV